jgi:hypothetical protein
MHPYLDDAAQIKVAQALQEVLASFVGIRPESAAVKA